MQIRRLFAGTNSARGFYSLFDQIIGPEAKKVYLLKGGPGTGKAFFMKGIAQALEEEGFVQEHFFCSSDSHSLDAVTFPELEVALIDATFPHAQDAKWPGCRDELICLGNFWDARPLEEKRDEIVEAGRVKAGYFAEAFRYFAAALSIEENMAGRNAKGRRDCAGQLEEILTVLHGGEKLPIAVPSKARHLFASALTPEGYVSQIQELAQGFPHRFILQGPAGTGKSGYLELILQHSELLGLQLEVFHYPLNPAKLLHILIPEKGVAVLSATELEPLANFEAEVIICGEETASNQNDRRLFRELIDLGIQSLQKAQGSHGTVEEYYAQAMDFSAVNALRDKVTAEILSYKNRS